MKGNNLLKTVSHIQWCYFENLVVEYNSVVNTRQNITTAYIASIISINQSLVQLLKLGIK